MRVELRPFAFADQALMTSSLVSDVLIALDKAAVWKSPLAPEPTLVRSAFISTVVKTTSDSQFSSIMST